MHEKTQSFTGLSNPNKSQKWGVEGYVRLVSAIVLWLREDLVLECIVLSDEL